MTDTGLLQRWLRFNGVGALGIAVQLGVLAWLVRGAGAHYLWATAIAVEAAVLHNFWWHERWTWRDRQSGSGATLLQRAARFHLLNGAISLGGNLLIMRLLTGSLDVDPLGANIMAIIVCSIVNVGASEWLVFRRAAAAALVLLGVHLAAAAPLSAAGGTPDMGGSELRAHTLKSWTTYEQQVDGRYESSASSGAPFFAMDAFNVPDWRSTALQGGAPMVRIERARPGDPDVAVSDGKIHHWAGAIFVPNTSVDAVLKRLADLAGNEQKYYDDVIGSRLLAKAPDHYRIFMKLRRTKVITVTYNTEHDVRYRRLGDRRASARSVATRIAELENVGTPGEREKKIGSDGGYLWRLNAYWRYEAVNGGVLIECESVSLSRSIPFVLRPFATGMVEGVARDSLERTLNSLRKYLRS